MLRGESFETSRSQQVFLSSTSTSLSVEGGKYQQMKFGRYLRTHTIPEWNRAYINYRLLKKAIGKAEAELQEQDDAIAGINLAGGVDEIGIRIQRTESPTQEEDLEPEEEGREVEDADDEGVEASRRSDATKRTTLSRSISYNSQNAESSGTQSGSQTAEPLVSPTASKKLDSRRPSTYFDTRRPSALGLFSPRRLSTSLQSPRGDYLTKAGDFNPKKFRNGFTDSSSTTISDFKASLSPQCKRFFDILDKELDRVADFYAEREEEAVKRFQELELNWKQLTAHKMEFRAAQAAANKDTKSTSLSTSTSTSQQPNKGTGSSDLRRRFDQSRQSAMQQSATLSKTVGGILLHGKPEEFTAAKSKLKLATFEYYRSLTMLKAYKVLNRTGFAKALKKFEKSTRISCSKLYTQKVDQMNFVASTRLEDLITRTEDAFTTIFEHGDRKKSLSVLRMDGDEKMHHFSSWRSGLYFGIGIPLLIMGLVECGRARVEETIPYYNALLQLFGAMFLPILFTGLFFFNLRSWHIARVNYVLIFELNVRTTMNYHQFLEIPSFLFFVYSICFWASFNNFFPNTIPPETYTLIFFIIALITLFMPFPILLPSARWWMVKSFFRVISSGLVKVEFRDFFLADEFNSLSYCMYNLGFLVCTFSHGWTANVQAVCSTNQTWTSPVLAALPAFWRLGQSIRRYLDSDGLTIHALNAGKYTATIVYYYVYFAWRIHGSQRNWLFAFWVVVSIINSTYTATWDILMDWNLGRKNSKHYMLRPELVFTPTWLYYVAIFFDIILRFSWVMYLSTSLNLSTQLRGYILAVVEVFRRIMWNALRVESEHVGNVDGYRVTRDIALPYLPRIRLTESTEDQDELKDNSSNKSKFFQFFHKVHEDMMSELKPITSISLPTLNGFNKKRRASSSGGVGGKEGEIDYGKKNRGHESSTPASESDGELDSATDIEAGHGGSGSGGVHNRLPTMAEMGKSEGLNISR